MALYKKAVYVCLLVIFSFMCSGCFGARETDENAYILAVGIDKAAGGKNKITYQLASPKKSKTEGKSSSEETYEDIPSIITTSPAETRMLLNSALSRYPTVNHVYIYIFSEEVARDGLSPRISYFIRNREFRESLFLMVVPGSAEEYIKKNKSTFETTAHKYYEKSMLTARETSYYLPTTFHNFYTRLKNNGGSTYTTYSSLNPLTLEEKITGEKTPQQQENPYIAGGVPRKGSVKSADFLGLAVFRQDKMVGVLNNTETRAVAMLNGSFQRSSFGVADPIKPERDIINVSVYFDSRPKIKATYNEGTPAIDITLNFGAEIYSLTSGINYESPENRKLLETQIENLITGQVSLMIAHTKALGTDPAGLGLYFRPIFKNTQELDQFELTSLYQEAKIHVNTKVTVHRTGLIWQTTPPKNG